ncbi:MAG: LemA family protein [Clostridia bacterium]|nr:LemA family protein [Clostridia bacterium]
MANLLDEMNTPELENGRDVNVIAKQIPVKVGFGSTLFEIMLWVLGIIPGIIFLVQKIKAQNYFRALEQKIQHAASQIDNYLEQRVVILKNCAALIEKAIKLDDEVFTKIAAYRSGANPTDEGRNELAQTLEQVGTSINVAVEQYPELKAHQEIQDAMQQNSYLQREITAAREVYNDTVLTWNTAIFQWPVKMIVAARAGYTSRIPFATTSEVKQQAREVLF